MRLRDEGKLGDELGGLFSSERPHELLFDVGKDPQQLDNVAGNTEHYAILDQMRLALRVAVKTGDSIPDVALMTPDRHDPSTFKRLYSERRPLRDCARGASRCNRFVIYKKEWCNILVFMKQKNILCFGDSNTWGFPPDCGARYDRKTRWPGVLQDALGDAFYVIEEGLPWRNTVWDDPVEGAKTDSSS